jgi:hypothetical protein
MKSELVLLLASLMPVCFSLCAGSVRNLHDCISRLLGHFALTVGEPELWTDPHKEMSVCADCVSGTTNYAASRRG